MSTHLPRNRTDQLNGTTRHRRNGSLIQVCEFWRQNSWCHLSGMTGGYEDYRLPYEPWFGQNTWVDCIKCVVSEVLTNIARDLSSKDALNDPVLTMTTPATQSTARWFGHCCPLRLLTIWFTAFWRIYSVPVWWRWGRNLHEATRGVCWLDKTKHIWPQAGRKLLEQNVRRLHDWTRIPTERLRS